MIRDNLIEYLQKDRRRSHYIAELDETIFFRPVTVLEMEKIMTLSQSGASTREFHVQTIIEKCEDESGKKIFSIEDRIYLEKMDWTVVSRISNEIHRTATVDEAKKN